jgi:hypothetical protein
MIFSLSLLDECRFLALKRGTVFEVQSKIDAVNGTDTSMSEKADIDEPSISPSRHTHVVNQPVKCLCLESSMKQM